MKDIIKAKKITNQMPYSVSSIKTIAHLTSKKNESVSFNNLTPTSCLKPKNSFLTINGGGLPTSSWITNSIPSKTSTVQSNQKESTDFISTPIIILICGSMAFLFVMSAFCLVLLIRRRKKENKYIELELGLRNEKGERLYDDYGRRIER